MAFAVFIITHISENKFKKIDSYSKRFIPSSRLFRENVDNEIPYVHL